MKTLLCVVAFALAACSGGDGSVSGDTGTEPIRTNPVVSRLSMSVDGGKAEYAPNDTVRVVVTASDAKGLVVSSELINFRIVEGGGSVFGGSAMTNSQGEAREIWSLGTQYGTHVLEARAVDQSTGEPIVYNRLVVDMPAPTDVASVTLGIEGQTDSLGLVQGTSELFRDGVTVVVTTRDAQGNPVPDVVIELQSGDGTLSNENVTTDVNGQARVTWIISGFGWHTIDAHAVTSGDVVFGAEMKIDVVDPTG